PELHLEPLPPGVGLLRNRELAARHHPPFDHDGELRLARVEPNDDPPACRVAGHQAGQAVDGDAYQPGRETRVPDQLAHAHPAPPLDRHEEDTEWSAGLAGKDLEVEKGIGGREGEMALKLEADHAPEVRAGDDRQIHGLRDHRAPGKADLGTPRANTRLEELTPDGACRVLVGGNAEGGEETPRPEASPQRDPAHQAG